MTLDEKKVERIRELKERGDISNEEIANAVKVALSSVKKYTSNDYEQDKIDEKTGNTLTEQMIEEGYDFTDEVKPLVYKLKIQANEIDITLYDYLNDISNTMNKFLRITDNPERLYYIFCQISQNLSVLTDHIEAEDLINAVNLFYDREIEFEQIEAFILEQKQKSNELVDGKAIELRDLDRQIEAYQESLTQITNLHTQTVIKIIEDPNRGKLKLSEERVESMENQIKELQMTNTILIEKGKLLQEADEDNEITRQENIKARLIFERLENIFPQDVKNIIREIDDGK